MDSNGDEADEFGNRTSYDNYVADLIKGVEMINILTDSNTFHIKSHKVSKKFQTLTNMLLQVRSTLSLVKIRLNLNKETDFWTYDFNSVLMNEKLKPVMPRLKRDEESKVLVDRAVEALKILSECL